MQTLIGADKTTAILSGDVEIYGLAGQIAIYGTNARVMVPGDKILDVETMHKPALSLDEARWWARSSNPSRLVHYSTVTNPGHDADYIKARFMPMKSDLMRCKMYAGHLGECRFVNADRAEIVPGYCPLRPAPKPFTSSGPLGPPVPCGMPSRTAPTGLCDREKGHPGDHRFRGIDARPENGESWL